MLRTRIPVLLALVLTLVAASCTGSSKNEVLTPAPGVRLKLSSPIFEIQPADIHELELTQRDPLRSEHWSVRLRREISGEWVITTLPDGLSFSDRRANSAFINHLLSTLTTLIWAEAAPQGSLENYGLDRPHYVLKFGAGQDRLQLDLGATLKDGAQRYAKVTGHGEALVVRGATLKMIDYLSGFDLIRLPTVLTFDRDQPDEVEVYRDGKRVLYAQRHNDGWADRNLKPVAPKVDAYLEYLTHLRVKRFEDSPEAIGKLKSTLTPKSGWRVVFRDRNANETELRARRSGKNVMALFSGRPEAAFELFPESYGRLDPSSHR